MLAKEENYPTLNWEEKIKWNQTRLVKLLGAFESLAKKAQAQYKDLLGAHETIQTLKEQKSRHSAELTQQKDEYEIRLQEQKNELEHKILLLQQQKELLVAESEDAVRNIQDLESLVRETEARLKASETHVDHLEHEVEDRKKLAKAAEDQHRRLEDTLEKLKGTIRSMKQKAKKDTPRKSWWGLSPWSGRPSTAPPTTIDEEAKSKDMESSSNEGMSVMEEDIPPTASNEDDFIENASAEVGNFEIEPLEPKAAELRQEPQNLDGESSSDVEDSIKDGDMAASEEDGFKKDDTAVLISSRLDAAEPKNVELDELDVESSSNGEDLIEDANMLASEEGGAIGAPAVMMDAIPELTKSETLEHREELEDLGPWIGQASTAPLSHIDEEAGPEDMKESTDKEDSSKDENADEDDVAAAAPEEEDNAAGVPSGGEDDANKAGVSARGEDDANAAGVSSGGEDDDDYDEDDNEKGDDDAEAVNLVPETLQPDTLDHEEDLQNLSLWTDQPSPASPSTLYGQERLKDVYDQSPGERSSAFEEDLAQEGMEEEGIANHEEATERLADVQEEPIKQRKGFTMHEVDAAISEPVNEAKEAEMDEPGEDAELDGLAKVNEELNEQSKGLRNLQADHEIGEHQMQAEEAEKLEAKKEALANIDAEPSRQSRDPRRRKDDIDFAESVSQVKEAETDAPKTLTEMKGPTESGGEPNKRRKGVRRRKADKPIIQAEEVKPDRAEQFGKTTNAAGFAENIQEPSQQREGSQGLGMDGEDAEPVNKAREAQPNEPKHSSEAKAFAKIDEEPSEQPRKRSRRLEAKTSSAAEPVNPAKEAQTSKDTDTEGLLNNEAEPSKQSKGSRQRKVDTESVGPTEPVSQANEVRAYEPEKKIEREGLEKIDEDLEEPPKGSRKRKAKPEVVDIVQEPKKSRTRAGSLRTRSQAQTDHSEVGDVSSPCNWGKQNAENVPAPAEQPKRKRGRPRKVAPHAQVQDALQAGPHQEEQANQEAKKDTRSKGDPDYAAGASIATRVARAHRREKHPHAVHETDAHEHQDDGAGPHEQQKPVQELSIAERVAEAHRQEALSHEPSIDETATEAHRQETLPHGVHDGQGKVPADWAEPKAKATATKRGRPRKAQSQK